MFKMIFFFGQHFVLNLKANGYTLAVKYSLLSINLSQGFVLTVYLSAEIVVIYTPLICSTVFII